MTLDDIVAAFALPDAAVRPTRIPKTVLNERGAATAADRKLIDAVIDRLDWVATLSPASIGVAGDDSTSAIQLLTLITRAAPTQRLLMIIHRAIPLPIILVTAFDASVRVSLAPLRPAERIEGAMVVERLLVSPEIIAPEMAARAFLDSLALPGLPRTILARLYEGLIWRVEAFTAARLAGGVFRLPATEAEVLARRSALAEHDAVAAEWARARAAARAEKQLARQVALAETARLIKVRLDGFLSSLG